LELVGYIDVKTLEENRTIDARQSLTVAHPPTGASCHINASQLRLVRNAKKKIIDVGNFFTS